jgi:hypothetical protein
MSSSAGDIPFIVQQIETCLQLAQQCNDEEIAGHLLALARTFAQRAIERGADPSLVPELAVTQSSS